MELYTWIKETKIYHLSIEDFLKWPIGEERKCIILDHNFEEGNGIWDNHQSGHVMKAVDFFKFNVHTITKKDGWKWDIHFNYNETLEHPIHVCVENLSTSCTWAGLNDCDEVHIKNEMLDGCVPFPTHRESFKINIRDFPKRNRIGWRGPIILYEYLEHLPDVYYTSLYP